LVDFRKPMIIAANWIFPVTSAPLKDHAIVIENGRISTIRPRVAGDSFYENACIIPGLINAHTHLAYTALRNLFDGLTFFPWIRKLTEVKYNVLTDEDLAVSTRLGIAESIRAGITTVADMCDCETALRVLSESPLRARFYWEVFGVSIEEAEQTWKGLPETYNQLKSKYSREGLEIGISPHACYTVHPELYRRVADWALRDNVSISFHAAESKAEEDFISGRKGPIAEFLKERTGDWEFLGKTSIEHLAATGIFKTKPLIAHAVQASLEDQELLARFDVAVAHCPKSNSKFGHGVAPVFDMRKKGIRVGLGTDSAASNNRLDLFEEARLVLMQQRAHYGRQIFSEQQVLELMTIESARALEMEREIGSLNVGKAADMIAVRIPSFYSTSQQVLNHLIYNAGSNDVLETFIGGKRVVYEAADPREIYAKLAE
jgi:cytosine/adenosine deaminase-related metal-dependent hydrolase